MRASRLPRTQAQGRNRTAEGRTQEERPAITIVLADDHQLVRQGLRALLEAEPGFRVVGEAGDGLEAVELVERLSPHVLVVDIMMPALGGLEVARQVHARRPEIRVVVLSMYADEAYVVEALRNGATAYVLKESTASDLATAVREALAGRVYLSPPLSRRAIDRYADRARGAAPDAYARLTTREREVLQQVAEGRTSAEIARRLGLSHRTVETHRANLMRKLQLRTRVDLVRFALGRGLIPPDSPLTPPGDAEEDPLP